MPNLRKAADIVASLAIVATLTLSTSIRKAVQ